MSNLILALAMVVSITDGDTIRILPQNSTLPIKVRLASVDCPEKKQPYGTQATTYTAQLLNQRVTVIGYGYDRYGRLLADIQSGPGLFNEQLIRQGICWAYMPRSATYRTLQNEAMHSKLGLWAFPNPIAPWDWRKQSHTTDNPR